MRCANLSARPVHLPSEGRSRRCSVGLILGPHGGTGACKWVRCGPGCARKRAWMYQVLGQEVRRTGRGSWGTTLWAGGRASPCRGRTRLDWLFFLAHQNCGFPIAPFPCITVSLPGDCGERLWSMPACAGPPELAQGEDTSREWCGESGCITKAAGPAITPKGGCGGGWIGQADAGPGTVKQRLHGVKGTRHFACLAALRGLRFLRCRRVETSR